jgi:L-ascorbate metabolism protein UlaG (beta-lactamase superfamily)
MTSVTRAPIRLTLIGGPTALIEIAGLRLLTDPTFDPAGTDYPTPVYVLHKTQAPALSAETIGVPDVVLLSHDHHFDNLDHTGRKLLETAGTVITTEAGANRLSGHIVGLAPWRTHEIPTPDGRVLRITATPARHGPSDGDRGPVIGIVLSLNDRPDALVYVSGDTVWYEGVKEVSRRFSPRVVVPFAGAARVREVGPAHLTLTATEVVEVARAFPSAIIVPVHVEGWAHFSESRTDVERAFEAAGLSDRLRAPAAGQPIDL